MNLIKEQTSIHTQVQIQVPKRKEQNPLIRKTKALRPVLNNKDVYEKALKDLTRVQVNKDINTKVEKYKHVSEHVSVLDARRIALQEQEKKILEVTQKNFETQTINRELQQVKEEQKLQSQIQLQRNAVNAHAIAEAIKNEMKKYGFTGKFEILGMGPGGTPVVIFSEFNGKPGAQFGTSYVGFAQSAARNAGLVGKPIIGFVDPTNLNQAKVFYSNNETMDFSIQDGPKTTYNV